MSNKRGRYYLGRVILHGYITKDEFYKVLQNPEVIDVGEYSWTITELQIKRGQNGEVLYVYGHLAKFKPEGEITSVDTAKRAEVKHSLPDLMNEVSPFVYLPEFSGIAFLHVWNKIEHKTFIRRFTDILRKTHGGLFADYAIEPISDLGKFYV